MPIAVLALWIAAGSALGGLARFLISGLVARAVGETFPWGTLVVNVSGALIIGAVTGAAQHQTLLARPEAWHVIVTGFLGSYTTVSSFSFQTLALINEGEWLRASCNLTLSLLLCLSAVTLGYVTAAGVGLW